MPVARNRRSARAGKAIALSRLARRVAPREGPPIPQRVALPDGAKALHQQMRTHVPAHTWSLDIFHATASLGDTANTRLGETQPQRTAWVRAALEAWLAGQTDAVITAVAGKASTRTATPPQAMRRTVRDDRRHRPYMRSDASLARGWPIGTGVVEGACGHVVKDRLEPSGRRWTNAGAQAVLDRRAARLNEPWEASWPLHRHHHQQRGSGRSVPAPASVDAPALAWAAC